MFTATTFFVLVYTAFPRHRAFCCVVLKDYTQNRQIYELPDSYKRCLCINYTNVLLYELRCWYRRYEYIDIVGRHIASVSDITILRASVTWNRSTCLINLFNMRRNRSSHSRDIRKIIRGYIVSIAMVQVAKMAALVGVICANFRDFFCSNNSKWAVTAVRRWCCGGGFLQVVDTGDNTTFRPWSVGNMSREQCERDLMDYGNANQFVVRESVNSVTDIMSSEPQHKYNCHVNYGTSHSDNSALQHLLFMDSMKPILLATMLYPVLKVTEKNRVISRYTV